MLHCRSEAIDLQCLYKRGGASWLQSLEEPCRAQELKAFLDVKGLARVGGPTWSHILLESTEPKIERSAPGTVANLPDMEGQNSPAVAETEARLERIVAEVPKLEPQVSQAPVAAAGSSNMMPPPPGKQAPPAAPASAPSAGRPAGKQAVPDLLPASMLPIFLHGGA